MWSRAVCHRTTVAGNRRRYSLGFVCLAGKYNRIGIISPSARSALRAAQEGIVYRMAHSLYCGGFFSCMRVRHYGADGTDTASTCYATGGRLDRFFQNAFVLAVCIALCLAAYDTRTGYPSFRLSIPFGENIFSFEP